MLGSRLIRPGDLTSLSSSLRPLGASMATAGWIRYVVTKMELTRGRSPGRFQYGGLMNKSHQKDQDNLITSWEHEFQQPFTGWDFSYLDGRMLEEQPPWSYTTLARGLVNQVGSVLDLGTGGGERLLRLKDAWPERVVVTEDYPPNVRLAKMRLDPLGGRVVWAELLDQPVAKQLDQSRMIICVGKNM